MDNKKTFPKKLLIPLIAAVLIAAVIFSLPFVRFKEGRPVLERGQEYKALDMISSYRGEVTSTQEVLKTDEIGDYTITYHVKNLVFEKDVDLHYEVKDTTPPEILIKETMVVLDQGEEFGEEDLKKNFSIDEGTYEYDSNIDYEFPGIYKVDIRAIDDYGNSSSASFNVVIQDVTPPMVLDHGYGAALLKNEEFNIHNYISYGDDSDGNVKLTVEGEVDTSKVGKYPLHIELEDDAGNLTEWDIEVSVLSKWPKAEEAEDYDYPFADFLKDYKGEDRSYGIDISTWQGEPDFEAVKKAGCEFVIMRIGYSYNGGFKVDDQFERNFEKAREAGLKTGVYLFSYDKDEVELANALGQCFELIGDRKIDLPIIFDWEDFFDFQDYQISFKQLNRLYDVFEQEVRLKGFEPMLYGSKYYLDNIWSKKDTRDVWLAQYADWPSYQHPYRIWQVEDHGVIDGIDGHVDINIMFE